jgi:hypothetical protein
MTHRKEHHVKNQRIRWGWCMIGVIVAVALAGCNNGRSPIEGAVTFDGKPVEEGVISLEPTDGQGPTTGGKIVDGKYELIGDAAPLPGKKLVRISAMRKTGRQIPRQFAPPGTMIDETVTFIPGIYNTESTLTCEISRDGAKQINFNLKSPMKTR